MARDSKMKVLLLGHISFAPKLWAFVEQTATVVKPESASRAGFIQECKSGAFQDVSIIYRTIASVQITGSFDEELIQYLPHTLRHICHNGAGYDQISTEACLSRQPPILVSHVPGAVNNATADTNLFLILGALRNFNSSILNLRQGLFRGTPPPPLGHDPQGKLLGILGMGAIGRNLKGKVEALGMTVQYHNRSQLDDGLSGGAKYVSFEELLSTSDVISLNLPLNPHTRHIISKHELAKMKDGVVIVNTARGAVMDEAALVALERRKVYSVGLDVFENEPEVHPGLLENPNVMLLPHMGTWTVETLTEMEECCIENVISAVTTGRLRNPVPEHARVNA